MPLNTGQILQQRYRIDALVDRGGMGTVYRATDLRFNASVAVKENAATSAAEQKQFAREAAILHHLRHPNLPRVSDHFAIPGQGQYLVMDYVEGQNLSQIVANGPVSEATALGWVSQVLDALEYLHSQNPPIIHRDVKPANIKITPQGQVFLVDFGLVKVDPILRTTTGAHGVTPGYAPPEQYGQGRTDARSDLYSVGATLYTLLTGRVPPDGVDLVMGNAALSPPRELNSSIRPATEKAILMAMQSRPAERPQTVGEFRTTLRVASPSRTAPAKEGPRSFVPPLRRVGSAWLWLAGVVALLLILALGGWRLLAPGKSATPAPTAMAMATPLSTPQPQWTGTHLAAPAPTDTPTPAWTPTRTLVPPATGTSMPPTPVAVESPVPTPSNPPPSMTPTHVPLPPTPTAETAATNIRPGGKLAFVSERDGNWEIYSIRPDGTEMTRLTDHPARDLDPSWSPDGNRMAFTSTRSEGGREAVYLMNADGSDVVFLTEGNNPAWSPDGGRIAFSSDRIANPDGSNNWEVYIINVDGTSLTNVTKSETWDHMPAWAPDGKRIAFESWLPPDGGSGLDVINTDGGGRFSLLDGQQPSWSPDGSQIALEYKRDIYVIGVDGTNLRNLTNRPGRDWFPAWSPDGQHIAFLSWGDGVQEWTDVSHEIYIMNSDGTEQTRISDSPGIPDTQYSDRLLSWGR